MKEIAGSVRVLWAEAVAKSNMRTKMYLVESPQPSAMGAGIVVKKEGLLHKPTLRGNRLNGNDLETWQGRVGFLQSKNNARLLTAVQNCFRGISFVRGHLRMRVNLGIFVLENYQIPEGDESWYGFEEFSEMLLHEQSKGRLVPECVYLQGKVTG